MTGYEVAVVPRPLGSERNLDILTRTGINKHYGDAQITQNLTGGNHTTVCTLDKHSSFHVGAGVTAGGGTIISDYATNHWKGLQPYTNQFAPRGWGSVVKAQFLDNADYVLIDLGAAENWTTNSQNYYLTFLLGGDQTLAGTILDIELLDSSSVSVSDHAVTAYAATDVWQFITIDVNADTLSDVQFIKIQCDTATGDPTIYLSDFVRTDANCFANDYTKTFTDNSVLGVPADFVEAYVTNGTSDDTLHLHINSLANSPYTVHQAYPRWVGSEAKYQPIYAVWVHGCTDTISKLWIEAEGRYL